MDSSELYVLCVAGIFVARLFYSSYNFIPREWKVNTRVWLRRHLFYVLLPRWLAFRTVTTRFDVLLHFLFISGNICAVTIGSDSSKDLADRLGRAALMNLIFLCLGYKTNIILDKCNIRLDRFAGLHRLAGVVMTLEAVLHSAFAGLGKTFTLSSHTTGLLALCAIGAIVVFSLPILSDRVYDLSAFIHTSLVVLVLVSLLLHVPGPSISQRPRLYALISILVFVTVKLLRYIGIMLASMSSKHLYIATIERVPGGTEVRVRVPSHWKLRAGQYIYLRVSWTYPDGASHKVIVLLIQARKGFTRRLLLADSGRQYPVLLDGPYGRHLGHEDYGTVLLFASGIGIAGQLPFARELLELYYDCRVKTRRVALFWEISEEAHRYWVKDWMNQLLVTDIDYILDVHVYIGGKFLSGETEEGAIETLGDHSRITLHYKAMRPFDLVESEINNRKGKTLVALCTDRRTTRTIMRQVCRMLDRDIRVKQLEFHPWALASKPASKSEP